MSERLTASELDILRGLMQRFAEHQLDQFENLRFDTGYGPAGAGAHEWGNPNLERFLEALQGFLNDLDGYYANRGQHPPAQPDWALFATALMTATGYE